MVGRNNSVSGGAGINRESVQSLWREAMVMRELARDGVSDAPLRMTSYLDGVLQLDRQSRLNNVRAKETCLNMATSPVNGSNNARLP